MNACGSLSGTDKSRTSCLIERRLVFSFTGASVELVSSYLQAVCQEGESDYE